jgi:predicted AAA+ superfamily ATPase
MHFYSLTLKIHGNTRGPMFTREIEPELFSLAQHYPVVAIVGPRQAGKTTLVQKVFPNKPYINLEAPDTREFAALDPRSFFEKYPEGAILDEIQRLPILLSYIQEIIDRTSQKGMFILTGSHQFELHQALTQSLAGRVALLKLLPLSITELNHADINLSLNEYLLKGQYPRVHKDKLDPTKAYRNYVQTYLERDLRQIINVKDLSVFQKFLKLCAGRVGQLLNMHSLGNELGVSSATIKYWISILEASYVVFLLQPYFENLGKRIIKSPKLYFTDVGLASYLLDINDLSQIERDPLRGNLVENLVILELLKTQLNKGSDSPLYFYRDSNQNEVDVLYKNGNELIPIEIKSAKTLSRNFFKTLNYFKQLTPQRCHQGFLIYAGETEQTIDTFQVLNYKNTAKVFNPTDTPNT